MNKPFHVLTFHSFKGGSGKSTFSLNFASYLAELGYKVLLVENDLLMPTYFDIFQNHWGKHPPQKFLNSFLIGKNESTFIELIASTNLKFDVICTDPNFDPQQFYSLVDQKVLRKSLFALQRAKSMINKSEKYNFIIFDCPPGWHFLVINNLIISDSVIIVSRINKYEVLGIKKMLEEIYVKTRQWKNNLYVLWNQVPRIEEDLARNLLVELHRLLTSENLSLKVLGAIPLSDIYSFESASGNMLLSNSKCETTRNSLNKLIQTFLAQL